MLDTDSEADVSKLQFREKLNVNSTTRNIRNRTIDVSMHGSSEFQTAKKSSRSNLSKTKVIRAPGQKKGSVQHTTNQEMLQIANQVSSKPTLFVESSEA